MDDTKQAIERIFLHFDDELGLLSVIGAGTAGAGLVGLLMEGNGSTTTYLAVLLVGIGFLVLDYFR
jgi:hypothetical protein